MFRVERWRHVTVNVVIGNNGADGIHTFNGAVLDNIYWMNVGEDAMTIKSSGTTTVEEHSRGTTQKPKFFQVNAASTLNMSNSILAPARRCGRMAVRRTGST